MWEEGWKQRYYKTKFDVDATDDDFRRKVVKSYVEGLCWVLRYYYQVTLTSLCGFVYIHSHSKVTSTVMRFICNVSFC